MNMQASFDVRDRNRMYVSVRAKFVLALGVALAWLTFSMWVSSPWMEELSAISHPLVALLIISFIAYIPGFMNSFLMASLLLDRRPKRMPLASYPAVSILIAAYQEETTIGDTLSSLAHSRYPGEVEILVLDDGSTDRTVEAAQQSLEELEFPSTATVRIVSYPVNRGKAAVLNSGLSLARHSLVVTVDADSWLLENSLTKLVERLICDPLGTEAVAGAVLVRNSRTNIITKAQEWDYFHGIAAVKRMQSMYHGTLVAQGAFSIYRKSVLEAVGGWPECVGEDIVLTWAMLKKGYRVGYAEDAIVFTNAPTTLKAFAQQRKRWSRGLVEAIEHHEGLLFKRRMTALFVWWNLLFLPLDLAYTFLFLPGILLALIGGIYWIAGPMTLAILPLAGVWNLVIYRVQKAMFGVQGLHVRRNFGGLISYLAFYAAVMQPVCVWGYVSELAGTRKKWGTK